MYNKNLKSFIIKFLLAFSFHYSAIIMLPLYFLNSKKISKVFFLLPIIGLIGGYSNLINIFLNTNIINILPKIFVVKIQTYLMLMELGEHTEKINIFGIYYLMSLLILYFLLFLYTQNRLKFSYDIILIKIVSIYLFIFYFFLPIPVFSFRLSEFLYTIMIILLPNFILYFKERIFMLFLISLLFMYIFFKSIY
ncbi:MAG: EpsG family protein, partial [Thermoprotei archaeon]